MNIIVFGAGNRGQRYISEMEENLVAVTDNNEALWGLHLYGVPIIPPNDIKRYDFDKIVIAMRDKDKLECEAVTSVINQLRDMGIPMQQVTIASDYSVKHQRVDFLRKLSQEMNRSLVKGAVAECGVSRGSFAQYINLYFPDKKLYLFDSFQGFSDNDVLAEKHEISKKWVKEIGDERHKRAEESIVLMRMTYPQNVIIKRGFVPDTLAGLENERFAFVNLDMDLYVPQLAALHFFLPRMVAGGVVLVHDYYNKELPGVRKSVDEISEFYKFAKLPIGDQNSIALVPCSIVY